MDPSSVNNGNTYIYSYVNSAQRSGELHLVHGPDVGHHDAGRRRSLPTRSTTTTATSAIDLTGNGQSNSTAGFYTGNGPNSAGPTLLYANPPNGMTNVPVNTNQGPWNGSSLGLLFNEPVASDSLGNITLTPPGGSPMPIAVYPEYGNTIAWVQLPWALSPNTQYTFNVTGVTDYERQCDDAGDQHLHHRCGLRLHAADRGFHQSGERRHHFGRPDGHISITFNEAMDPVLHHLPPDIYLQTHNTHSHRSGHAQHLGRLQDGDAHADGAAGSVHHLRSSHLRPTTSGPTTSPATP